MEIGDGCKATYIPSINVGLFIINKGDSKKKWIDLEKLDYNYSYEILPIL